MKININIHFVSFISSFFLVTFIIFILSDFFLIPKAFATSTTRLGGLDLWHYCVTQGQTSSSLNNSTWQCDPSGKAIDLNSVCQIQYNNSSANASQDVQGNPYSWSCYASNVTKDDVQKMITDALTPIHTSISDILTRLTNLENAFAPLPNQVSSLQTAVASNSAQLGTIKSLKVFDANGNFLGILVDHNNSFNTIFSAALNRLIYLNDNTFANQTAALYQSADCTGTPYDPNIGEGHNERANDLLPFGKSGIYFILNNPDAPTTISTASQQLWDSSSNKLNCVSDVRTNIQAYQLFPVNLPFSVPLAMPLQIKYQ